MSKDDPIQRLEPYLYTSVPGRRTIRIVTLEAGAPECPIYISLSLLNIDSFSEPYEAISYAWGESKDRENIICEGKRLSVTKSLYEALHVFRDAHNPRRLWADGICINQSDKDERSHQVQLMRLVYSSASKVLIWLGNGDSNTVRIAFDEIDRLYSLYSQFTKEGESEKSFDEEAKQLSRTGSWNRDKESLIVTPDILQQLLPLYQCKWFNRLWVLQEVALSKKANAFWGTRSIDFLRIATVGHYIYEFNSSSSFRWENMGLPNAATMHNLWTEHWGPEVYFFDLLDRTCAFEVTDPRDRIYGLLGLPVLDSDPSANSLFIEPDYSLTAEQVYAVAAKKILVQQKQLSLLAFTTHEGELPEDGVSWAPKWTNLEGLIFPPVHPTDTRTEPVVSEHSCGKEHCLSFGGFSVGVVSLVMPAAPDQNAGKCAAPIGSLSDALSDVQDPKLLAWFLKGVGLGKEAYDNFAVLREWKEDKEAGVDSVIKEAAQPNRPKSAWHFLDVGEAPCTGRLFIDNYRTIGMGPRSMRKDDVVVNFVGGPVPFVLRPTANSHYRFLGYAYTTNSIDGKAVRERNRSGGIAINYHVY